MNTQEFQCGHCGKAIAVAADHLDRDVQCPHCQQFVKAPGAATSLPAVPGPRLEAPLAPTSAEASLTFDRAPTALPGAPASPRWPQPRHPLTSMLLVFLIPYAIVATGVIAWLLWKQPRDNAHPLEWLLDQQPADGGPRQIKHDLPLLDRQKTPLGQAIKVGEAVELTPLNVVMAPKGDSMELTVRLRNISKDLRLNPMPRSFLVRTQGYTFLEFGKQKIYGGRLSYHKTIGFWANIREFAGAAPRPAFEGVLDPGEEMVATLLTSPRDEGLVRKLTDFRGPLVWRLEVRRGLALVGGKTVSATAVVGVEFDAGVFLHDQRDLVRRGVFALPPLL
jgi:DNA-directed RNA polymerase subunit RPC12/RpoP